MIRHLLEECTDKASERVLRITTLLDRVSTNNAFIRIDGATTTLLLHLADQPGAVVWFETSRLSFLSVVDRRVVPF